MSDTDPGTYYRVSPEFWQDDTVRGWAQSTRMVALYLLTSPNRLTEGLFRQRVAYAVADTQMTAESIEEALRELAAGDDPFIERDGDMVLIVNALKWQAPRAVPNAKHAARQITKRKLTGPLVGRLLALADELSPRLAAALREEMPDLTPEPRPSKAPLKALGLVPSNPPNSPAPAPAPAPGLASYERLGSVA
jgi:hypothetical protein